MLVAATVNLCLLQPYNPKHYNHNPLTPLSQDVQRLMDKGKANRSVGATCMNEHSSRSHCILSVYTESRAVATGARAQGKLHLIDLAGSERCAP